MVLWATIKSVTKEVEQNDYVSKNKRQSEIKLAFHLLRKHTRTHTNAYNYSTRIKAFSSLCLRLALSLRFSFACADFNGYCFVARDN